MIGLVAVVLEVGQDRGEIRADVPAPIQALTVTAGALFPAVQAASVGADPAPIVGEALSMLWVGLEANGRPRSRARGR
jgi:hypothetical protein